MPTAKKQVLDLVKKLPDNATWDDIMYRISVCKKIVSGATAADKGRVVSHYDVKLFFALTTEVRRAMTHRGISEKAILRDFEKSRKLHSR